MQTLHGEVVRLNTLDATLSHAAGSTVMVLQDRQTIATGAVDSDESFAIALPAGTTGAIEIRLDLHGSAPVTASVEPNEDLRVQIFFNNQAQLA